MKKYRWHVCCGVVLLPYCLVAGSAALSAENPGGKSPVATISGTVTDPAGRPDAGAKVWLTSADFPHAAQVLQTAVTDSAGRFSLSDPPRDGGAKKWLTLAARDAKGRLGGMHLPPPGDPAGQAIRIELVEVHDHRGKFTDAAGGPIAKVALRPMRMTAVAPGRPMERHPFAFPPELAAEVGGRTAGDGSFVLRGVPPQGDVMVEVVASEFGSPWVFWELSKSVTIRLDRAGSVAGSLTGAEAPAMAGVKLLLWKAWSRDDVPAGYQISLQKETLTGKDGSFQFPAVPPGTYRVRAELDEKSPYATGDSPDFKVKPGEQTTKAALALRRLITVRGRVIDRETKAGVRGAALEFYTMTENRDLSFIRETKTDAQGESSLRLLPGQVCGYVSACPEQYTVPDAGPGLHREPSTTDTAWPVIELERGTSVEGVVVDESGRAAAQAEVRFLRTSPSYQIETVKCDPAGKFVLKQLPNKGTLSIQARTDSAATVDPVTLALDKRNAPLRLVVSQTKAGGVRGVLVDEAGQPIRQGYVFFSGYWSIGASKRGFQMPEIHSDDQGRFEVRGLWPGEYQLQVLAEGIETPQPRAVTLRQGQSIDFGKIVLDSARRVIEGTVLDSAGKPLPGVRVFNSGDAPRRVSTQTDAAGRFRLQGFREGAAYVFAQQPGYRFRAVLAKSGATGVIIRLPCNDEIQPRRAAPTQLSEQRRHELARALLEKLWEAGDHAKMDEAIVAMALLDPPKAQQWAGRRGPEFQETSRTIAAMRMAETDLDETIAALPPDGSRAVMFLRHLAERYAADEPAKALRCTEEGVVRARALPQPERAESLAWFGGLVIRLGRQETGRKLVEEAAQIAARLPATESSTRARGEVAAAVADFDLKGALELLKPIRDRNQRSAWLPKVAAAASVDHPDQSRALWKELEPFYLSRAKAATACRLAATRPDEALRLVEEIAGGESPVQKVEALGWIAVTVARRDKPRAFAIVDRGLALAMDSLTETARVYCQTLPAKAALVAVHAQRIGYPDLQSVSDRVLASRLTLRDATVPGQALESSLALAAILAMADPETAGQLLRALEPQMAHLDATGSRLTKTNWFQAWALADPKHAVELAEREWAAGSKTPGWDIANSGILEVPLVLGLPQSERLEYVGQRFGVATPNQ
jgi:protocatechuate 3,4-dioxygenase beta subunit